MRHDRRLDSGATRTLLKATGLKKAFGHVQVLRGVNLEIRKGEVLSIVGDNGAGKSTFLSILTGIYESDAGEVRINGRLLRPGSVEDADDAGITAVYQDLALCPDLTAPGNIFLGREIRRAGLLGRLGFMDKPAMNQESDEAIRDLGIELPSLDAEVGKMSGGQRQVVAISRAVKWASELLIMDEPTAALGAKQTKIVLETIDAVKSRGLTVLLVSHDLPSVLKVSDRIAVMRLGQINTVLETPDASVSKIVELMLGGREAA